jgi:hypothetical protein
MMGAATGCWSRAMTDDEQQNIQNDAPNQGAQGQFHGDVNTGTQQDVSGENCPTHQPELSISQKISYNRAGAVVIP